MTAMMQQVTHAVAGGEPHAPRQIDVGQVAADEADGDQGIAARRSGQAARVRGGAAGHRFGRYEADQ